jgi:hypothetical protein
MSLSLCRNTASKSQTFEITIISSAGANGFPVQKSPYCRKNGRPNQITAECMQASIRLRGLPGHRARKPYAWSAKSPVEQVPREK